jgi:CBF/Mak21 family
MLSRVRPCLCARSAALVVSCQPRRTAPSSSHSPPRNAAVRSGSKVLARRYKFKTRRRREDAIAAALQEAAAAADSDQVRLHQSQMLEALFELFFRVLKRCTASGILQQHDLEASLAPRAAHELARKWPLLEAALLGLAKYTHLIGLEYFTDLMEVLQQLQGCCALPLALRLQALLAAMQILQAQGDALNVDRRRMYMHLYSALAVCAVQHVCDSADDAHGDDALCAAAPAQMHDGDADAVRTHAQEEECGPSCEALVARTASQMLAALKVGDSARLAAFLKRLCACALHAEPGLSLAAMHIAMRCASHRSRCALRCTHPCAMRTHADMRPVALQATAEASEASGLAGGRGDWLVRPGGL